jgi:hypothetical protein
MLIGTGLAGCKSPASNIPPFQELRRVLNEKQQLFCSFDLFCHYRIGSAISYPFRDSANVEAVVLAVTLFIHCHFFLN